MLLFTVVLGSTPSLPGESCREIKANEAGEVVSGSFWLDPRSSGEAILAYCDMNTEGFETLYFLCVSDVHEISHKTFWPGVLVPKSNYKKGMKVPVINLAEI